jgi:hypothetical protein
MKGADVTAARTIRTEALAAVAMLHRQGDDGDESAESPELHDADKTTVRGATEAIVAGQHDPGRDSAGVHLHLGKLDGVLEEHRHRGDSDAS